MKTIRQENLRNYAAALLRAGGFLPAYAEQTADVLVWANARGMDSHGVLRIPRYFEMVEQGVIDPVANIEIKHREGAVAVLEAGNAPGASSMVSAMNEAVTIAAGLGIGWCSARNITHAGAVGYYALQAARKGYIGIVMTASAPLMAYHGASKAGVSTNPIAIGVPSSQQPILLDMSTSTVALGKILIAKDRATAIPADWGLDACGAPTTNPNSVETLTPLGGPKGSGLSLMIEVLASVLVSNPIISQALTGSKISMNGLALALNINAFANPDTFAAQIVALVASLKGLPKSEGVFEILMPGERGFNMSKKRSENGIPLAEGTCERLVKLAQKLGVETPSFQPEN